MYNRSGQKYKDTVELKLKWSIKIYHNKRENVLIRFENAYFMFLEQEIKENTFNPKKQTSREIIKNFDGNRL